MALRQICKKTAKRPLKSLFFFPGENMTGIAPTKLIVEKDLELREGLEVKVNWQGKKVRAKILALNDDEKELNAKDIEWSKHNLPVSETDKDRTENDAEANAEPLTKEKPRKEMKTKAAVEPLNPPAADPYAEFLKAQKKREAMWSAERAAKRAKVNSTRVENSREIRSGASQISEGDKVQNSENLQKETTQISESDEVGPLKREALEKTEAFEIMAKRVENLQESNRLAETRLRNDFCKMVDKMESAIALMESRLGAKLDSIEERLDRLEASSTEPAPIMTSCSQSYSQDTESSRIYLTADGTSNCENDSDLLTIDEDALSRMQELFPVSPIVPPTEPSQPAQINNSSTPVAEDLVRSCVTPRKVQRVRETLQSETDRYKCAIKLLPDFFTPAELAMSNTDGNFGKQPLDKTKLHTLKVLIFTTFPVGPEEEESKCWRLVKCKINAKCRSKRFERALREK